MNKRIAIATIILSVLALSACKPNEIRASIATRTVCVEVVTHGDFDPEGVRFEGWANGRNLAYGGGVWSEVDTGKIIGYTLAEDDAIWLTEECAKNSR
jgi:hypothetical protein